MGVDMKEWTKEEIKEMLINSQAWLERGVLAIYSFQTFFEQEAEETTEDNGVGFNAFDANYLSYIAKYLQSGRHLSGDHVGRCRKRMVKYARQLAEIANSKLKAAS